MPMPLSNGKYRPRQVFRRNTGIEIYNEATCNNGVLEGDEFCDRDTRDCFLSLEFLARDLPAVGCARFRLVEGDGPRADDFTPVTAADWAASSRLPSVC